MLNEENYLHSYLRFNDRQAGISVIYDPKKSEFSYNAYCIETKILKELVTVEFDFLEDGLSFVNSEFEGWTLEEFKSEESGCGNCSAK